MNSSYTPTSLDQLHNLLGLLGAVLGQITLLEVATDPLATPAARVAAARQLVQSGEDPQSLAARLRASPFVDLSVSDLERIVQELKTRETRKIDLAEIIKSVKGE